MAERVLTHNEADGVLAARITESSSLTRAALNAILPKSTGGTVTASASVTQYVRQRADGTWVNPVRDANVGGRMYVAQVDATKTPTYSDGLQAGDQWVSSSGLRVATFVPSVGAPTWLTVATGTSTGSTGGGGSTPTDPGTGTPTNPGDTSSPSPTSRPYAVLGSAGTWSSPAGKTLTQSLSDQDASSVSATPVSGNSGVSLTLDMSNFQHTIGNDLNVTLWGASSSTAGNVTVSVGYQGTQYAPDKTLQVAATANALAFVWPADEQLSLLASQWKDVEITISRGLGGFTQLVDVTLQSLPKAVTQPSGTDPTAATAVMWAPSSVIYSNVTSAPLAKANLAVAAYVKAQAAPNVRLDCYADAAPIWMAPASTPRLNVTPLTSTRGAATLMHTTDGKGAMDGVAIPAGMTAPANTFKTAVIADPNTKQLWEFLGLTGSGSSWSAEWGGRIDNYATSGAAFPTGTGYTGSGLAWAAGAIKVSEARDAAAGNAKAIPHVIGLNLNYDSASSGFCWPATRSDGTSSDPGAPKMGQRLRIKSKFNVASSSLTPLGKAIASAMQTYGAIVMGGADKISVIAESGAAEQAKTGVDPWGAILNGKTVDTVLAGLPLDQLEAVSPGWGDPNWKAETDVVVPTNPGTGTGTTPTTGSNAGNRRAIYINTGQTWLSGASCKAIEDSSEGMASVFAQWRGEPCYMGRTWWDAPGATCNDTLGSRWKNWHASMDCGPGFFYKGESMSQAAAGAYESRWKMNLQQARQWWASRRDPSMVNVFISPAHEMNGSWYPWAVTQGNASQFITAWKRYRTLQMEVFPEALLTFNANRDTQNSLSMDWRKIVPGYTEGGVSAVKQWVDVGAVDYYNQSGDQWIATLSEWADRITWNDAWGAPQGLDKHRAFWGQCGLPMTIPEWGNNLADGGGDSPAYADGMNTYIRKWAGVGPGQICAEAMFNISVGYAGKFAVVGDTVGSPQFAERYRALTWGK